MTHIQKSLLWAATIIIAAIFTQMIGLDNGESLALTSGLTGLAVMSVYKGSKAKCGRCAR